MRDSRVASDMQSFRIATAILQSFWTVWFLLSTVVYHMQIKSCFGPLSKTTLFVAVPRPSSHYTVPKYMPCVLYATNEVPTHGIKKTFQFLIKMVFFLHVLFLVNQIVTHGMCRMIPCMSSFNILGVVISLSLSFGLLSFLPIFYD